MENVISLDDFRNKKEQQKQQQETKTQDSKSLSFEERHERIKQSIARINSLISQLQAQKT